MSRKNKECHYDFNSPKAIEKIDEGIARHLTLDQLGESLEIAKSQRYKVKKICIAGWGRRDLENYLIANPGIENKLKPDQKIEIAKELGEKAYQHFIDVTNEENLFLNRHKEIIQLVENNILNHEPISIYKLQHESEVKGFYTIKNIIEYVEKKLGIENRYSEDWVFHRRHQWRYNSIIEMKNKGIPNYQIWHDLHLDKVTLNKIESNPYFIQYVEESKPKIEKPKKEKIIKEKKIKPKKEIVIKIKKTERPKQEKIKPEIEPKQVPSRLSLDELIAQSSKNYNPLADKKILEANQKAMFREIEERRQK